MWEHRVGIPRWSHRAFPKAVVRGARANSMARTINQKDVAKVFAKTFGSSSVKWGRAKQVLAKAGITGMFDRAAPGVHARSRSTFTKDEVKTIFAKARDANAALRGTSPTSFTGERGELRGRRTENIFQYLAKRAAPAAKPVAQAVRRAVPNGVATLKGRLQALRSSPPAETRQPATPVQPSNPWRADGNVSAAPTIRPVGSAGVGVTRYTQEAREKPRADAPQPAPPELPDVSHVDDGIPL